LLGLDEILKRLDRNEQELIKLRERFSHVHEGAREEVGGK